MPTKGCDCIGFAAYTLGNDGKFHPVDLSQTVTLSFDDADENTWSIDTDMSFTLETKMNRAMLKLLYPWREVRRRLRMMEKERRKRLKEVGEDARNHNTID